MLVVIVWLQPQEVRLGVHTGIIWAVDQAEEVGLQVYRSLRERIIRGELEPRHRRGDLQRRCFGAHEAMCMHLRQILSGLSAMAEARAELFSKFSMQT
jgi:hypothetical protein